VVAVAVDRKLAPRGSFRSRYVLRLPAAVILAAVVLAGDVSSAAGAATGPRHAVQRVVDHGPDPGFLKAGPRYFLYTTGPHFPMTSSTDPTRGFPPRTRSMPTLPRWFGPRSDGDSHFWAPDVFKIRAQRDGTRFVMYFTASKAGGHDCIGVAVASSAAGPFVDRGSPLRCASHANLVDPSMFQAPDGRRYVVYKADHFTRHTSQIRALRTTASGIHPVKGAASRPLASGGLVTIESPQVVTHARHAWLFVSRRSWTNCTYFTQVWRAPSIAGRFTPVGGSPGRRGYFDINRPSGRNFCGPGGADLIHAGSTWRIAFHVWEHGVRVTGGVRSLWTGQVRWSRSTGLPSMARLPHT